MPQDMDNTRLVQVDQVNDVFYVVEGGGVGLARVKEKADMEHRQTVVQFRELTFSKSTSSTCKNSLDSTSFTFNVSLALRTIQTHIHCTTL